MWLFVVWPPSRLCGRPFCYYCCSNTVSTQQGGSREHCCVDCYNLHSAVVERHPQEEVAHGAPGTLSRLLQAGRAVTGIAGDARLHTCTVWCHNNEALAVLEVMETLFVLQEEMGKNDRMMLSLTSSQRRKWAASMREARRVAALLIMTRRGQHDCKFLSLDATNSRLESVDHEFGWLFEFKIINLLILFWNIPINLKLWIYFHPTDLYT